MKSNLNEKWVFILLGDNDTGKTTFQKYVIEILCGYVYKKLPSNKKYEIYFRGFRNLEDIFIMGRSFQEKYNDKYINDFFLNDFIVCDICILSSHVNDEGSNCKDIIKTMIDKCHEKYYNVSGVFFSNAQYDDDSISLLEWDLRINFQNKRKRKLTDINFQIKGMAQEFVTMLLRNLD